ncbi:MAG: tRNA (N6-threonylcarbamoyladenosine(37)-N6)-methyltransferase TrmO [Candidatus Sericytochromatia bacterium]
MKEKFSFNSEEETKILFSDDGKIIIYLDKKNLSLYEFNSKKLLLKKELDEGYFYYYFYNNCIYLVHNKKIIILDISNLDDIKTKVFELKYVLSSALVLNDKKVLIGATEDFKIIFYNSDNFQEISCLEGHTNKINTLKLNPFETYLFSTSDDGTTKMWDIKFLSISNKSINENNTTKHYIKSKSPENKKNIDIKPIGYLKCNQKDRYEAPRQGIHSKKSYGYIELNKYNNFEQALQDLDGIERIWLIYHFHINDGWKPLVNPPRFLERKIGVFATRSPFRPNPIGISCVKLEKVEDLKVFISEFDLLDGTPIIDIKPYIPYADSFPNAKTGWLKSDPNTYEIIFSEIAKIKNDWLLKEGNFNIEGYTNVQLQFSPDNTNRKRIIKINTDLFILKFRTWDITYKIDFENKKVNVLDITSIYIKENLKELFNDKLPDKKKIDLILHEKFLAIY